MPKTVQEKLTDRILEMLKSANCRRDYAQLHLVVHQGRLKLVNTLGLFPGDTYILKVTNQQGNTCSRLKVIVSINILDRHIALTPLLKKRKTRY